MFCFFERALGIGCLYVWLGNMFMLEINMHGLFTLYTTTGHHLPWSLGLVEKMLTLKLKLQKVCLYYEQLSIGSSLGSVFTEALVKPVSMCVSSGAHRAKLF